MDISNNLWDIFRTPNSDDLKQQFKKNNDECVDCGEDNFVKISGEVICTKCGNISDGILDYNAEWRYYGSEDSKYSDPTRCGLPTNDLLPQSSLGSTISFKSGESYEMRKIRNYHLWNGMPYKERSLYNVFDSIQVIAVNGGIPSCIIEEAKILYSKISETKISRGFNRKGIIATCIYKACLLQGSPRSTQEIAKIFKLDNKHMTRGCKNFDSIMNIHNQDNASINISGSNAIDFVNRFCSNLNLGSKILEICKYVCNKTEEYNLVSKCIPPSVTAGSIFLVCNLLNINISKKDISVTCEISEVTISKCYKELLLYHQYLLPKDIIDKLYND
jgi:transcription initiation factor TFIIB